MIEDRKCEMCGSELKYDEIGEQYYCVECGWWIFSRNSK